MKNHTTLIKTAIQATIAICLCQPFLASATISSTDLPDISLLSSYTEFGNSEVESLVTVNGNVGVSQGGTLNLMGPSAIDGNVYVSTGATFDHVGTVTGTIYTGQNLTANQQEVFTASSAYTALGSGVNHPDFTFATLNSSQSFSAAAGQVTVVNVGNLSLNNANINFSGAGYLVINVTGSFSLVGTAGILDTDPSHVFVNYTGTGSINTHVGDTIDGYVFDPKGSGSLDGTWFGGLYGGDGTITLLSGCKLTAAPQTPPVVPEASTITAGALMLLPLGAGILRTLRKSRN